MLVYMLKKISETLNYMKKCNTELMYFYIYMEKEYIKTFIFIL